MNWTRSDFIGPIHLKGANVKVPWAKIDEAIEILNALTPEQKNAVLLYGQDKYKAGLNEGWEDGRDFERRHDDECY